MLSIKEYQKIKDKYCIAYLGHCREYWVLLKYLRPWMEKSLPGVEIHLCCRDELLPMLESEKNVHPISSVSSKKDRKQKFNFFRELKTGLSHPIENLMDESGIPYPSKPAIIENPKTYMLVDAPCSPTQSLTKEQKSRVINLIHNSGCQETNAWADWVIGVESEQLFEAAIAGRKTTLISTGVGQGLYQKICNGDILKF